MHALTLWLLSYICLSDTVNNLLTYSRMRLLPYGESIQIDIVLDYIVGYDITEH